MEHQVDGDLSGLYGFVEERGHIFLFVSVSSAENHHPVLKHKEISLPISTEIFRLDYNPGVNLSQQDTRFSVSIGPVGINFAGQ